MANECIPLYRPGQDITVKASAAVTGKTFVKITGALKASDGTLATAAPADAAGLAFGVAAYDAAKDANVAIICGPGHVVPVTAGGAVTAGAEVQVGAGGKAVVLAAGKPAGLALSTSTADGDELFVQLY